jgi:hypothetical protein
VCVVRKDKWLCLKRKVANSDWQHYFQKGLAAKMANISELLNGWGFGKQTAIGTANLVATIWRHTNLNTKPWAKVPVNEDDRAEIGKGHEFPTQLFKSHYNMPAYELSKYASSEFLAWALSFSMGNVVVSGSGPYTYTIVPALGATNPTGLELPYFSFVQQIRPGGSAVLDEMLVGCAVKGWKLSIKNSPGRASATCSVECVTTGQYTSPSGITLPAISTPHEFNAGMISALTFNGINYLSRYLPPTDHAHLDRSCHPVQQPTL